MSMATEFSPQALNPNNQVSPQQQVTLTVHAVRMALDHCLGRGAYDPRLAHQLYLQLTRKPK